jgi:uncharacterized protein YcbK (DUF882 family)
MIEWNHMRFFKPEEFDSLDEFGSGLAHMNIKFIQKLDNLRAELAQPLKINSGYRTVAANREAGGKRNSAHRKGLAADIACSSSVKRFDILEAAIFLRFRRIGIGKTFIHLDMSKTLPQGVMWLY